MRLDQQRGTEPVAVVATSGTVNTGVIDPLPEVAAIAKQYGALGAIAVPQKFKGIALADSISLDPHKWLYQPIDCGCLLYRDASAAQRAFANSGAYVRVLDDDPIEGGFRASRFFQRQRRELFSLNSLVCGKTTATQATSTRRASCAAAQLATSVEPHRTFRLRDSRNIGGA